MLIENFSQAMCAVPTSQLPLQDLARLVDPTLDRTQGQSHVLGNFFVLIATKGHEERLAQAFVQFVEGRRDFLNGNLAFATVADNGLLGKGYAGDLHFLGLLRSAPFAPFVDEGIAHNGHQPGLQIGFRLVLVLVAQGFIHRVLVKVFGIVAILSEVVGEGL